MPTHAVRLHEWGTRRTITIDRWSRLRLVWGLCVRGQRDGEAFDGDAFGFEVGDAVVGAVSHEDGFGEELDEWAGVVREPAVVGLVVVDQQVVGGVALWADELGFEGAVKGASY